MFGRAAFEECGQYFRALRFTSEDSGKHKQVGTRCAGWDLFCLAIAKLSDGGPQIWYGVG